MLAIILILFNRFNYRKLRNVLTTRILKFLNEKSQKQIEDYNKFYKDYSIFLKEGIVSSDTQEEKVIIIYYFYFCDNGLIMLLYFHRKQ